MTDSGLRSPAASRRSLSARWRTEMYLTRLDWHLEGVLPGKERRETIRELRQALAGDPRDMAAALSDLGSPRALARQYAEDGICRPFWSVGVITAGAALLV